MPEGNAASSRYWKVTRNAWIERWRFGVTLRIFHGFGMPKFEFDFRLGFPRERSLPEYIELEGSLADGI